jgi:ribose/xylose/arabinose/galactoside ABC-type transport system permease subunit
MRALLANRTIRPFLLLVAIAVAIAMLDGGRGRFFTAATAFSVLQQFATVGPIALGLGLTMIIREFDLSVGGMMSLAGCVAVLTGVGYPALGVAAAVLVGGVAGLCQGAIMVRLRLGSIGVTLGGLLTLGGLAYVITGNLSIAYPRMDIAMAVNQPVLQILSLRSIVALAAFLIAAFLMARTRIGRDVYAIGSDRRAALVAGVQVGWIVVGVFALSAMLSALGGSLLSYSLATASGVALTDALVPATAAAIIGGVSLTGGKGTPIGIVGGVLVLSLLRAGLNAIGTQPSVQEIVTGGVLLVVALADAPDLGQRLFALRALRKRAFE